MIGHITKRGKDSYTIVLSLGYDERGKRIREYHTLKGTKKDAERQRVELLHQADTGTYIKPRKVTLAEYLQQWLQDYAVATLAPERRRSTARS